MTTHFLSLYSSKTALNSLQVFSWHWARSDSFTSSSPVLPIRSKLYSPLVTHPIFHTLQHSGWIVPQSLVFQTLKSPLPIQQNWRSCEWKSRLCFYHPPFKMRVGTRLPWSEHARAGVVLVKCFLYQPHIRVRHLINYTGWCTHFNVRMYDDHTLIA